MLAAVASGAVLAGGGAVLGGCGGGSGPASLAAQVTQWADTAGLSASLPRLRADLARTATAAPGAPLRTACDVLVTDSLADNDQLPTPDRTLTDALSRAYARAAVAGRACFEGAAGDHALLASAAGARAQAVRQLVVAEARYDAIVSVLPGSGS